MNNSSMKESNSGLSGSNLINKISMNNNYMNKYSKEIKSGLKTEN